MTVVNEREYAGDNAERVFTLSVTDTNEHDLPDTGGDDSEGGDPFSLETGGPLAVKVYNPQDQDATVRLEATNYDDAAFENPEEIVSDKTVSATGGVETLVADKSVPFDWYRVVVSFSTTPTGNDAIEAAYMTDQN